MSCNGDEECGIRPGTVTPKKLPKQGGGGGHEFVTDLPETGEDGVEYVLMDDISDCSTYRGTFVWNPDCEGWIPTSGSGGGAVERYTFEQTATGWRAKRNNTVIFTYVDKDTIDSYEDTADGFQITRNGVVIFTHTDGGGGKTYTIESTSTGWVFKEDGTVKFTYTEPANDPSDGTYFTSGTLTTAITGTTTVAASSVTGLALADVVIGETLIYDQAGTVGRVTAVNGTNLTVETITTAPGERRGTRLGAVDDYTDLPATCAAAVALGWQTPLAGDFAYVREDSSHDSHLTEWVIQSIDSSCNITWGYSHTLNAGNYVLDIYKYGDYPSGSPIPKNPDGSVTLPKDEDTKYDFENLMDGSDIIGWRVKDHETGTVLYTYTDLNDNDTYTFEDVTVSGNIVGWRVKDKNGTVIYTYTDLNDKSDGTYFTSTTLDTDITDTTTVAASTVTGLTLSDVVIGETLIFDGDGTVGRVTAVTGTDLTVETITVSGSGDASSYVYKTTGTLDTTVDNTVNLALSTLKDALGNTPTASDIIIGKTLAWDADGTVALAVAISGTDVTFKTITTSGGGGSVTYLVDDRGDDLEYALFRPTADTTFPTDTGAYKTLTWNRIASGSTPSGKIVLNSAGTGFVVPDGSAVRIEMSVQSIPLNGTDTNQPNIALDFFRTDTSTVIATGNLFAGKPINTNAAGYQDNGIVQTIFRNDTGADVVITPRFRVYQTGRIQAGWTSLTVHEVGRVVDPIKYLDNSEGLQDTPVGNIISYMGNNVPRHYLACDGTIYNIGDYPALEAHFVEEFGSVNYFGGNGTTTWAVPDLQGEFLRGTGTNSHTDQGSGANVGVHQDATNIPYVRNLRGANNLVQFRDGGSSNKNILPTNMDSSRSGAGFGNINFTASGDSTIDTLQRDYTARPTNTSVKYCIKYESTMQVILGNEQYKVGGTFTPATGVQVWQKVTLTPSHGDTSLVNSGVYYAPVTGYYSISADTGWTDEANASAGLWMTWQKRSDNIPGNTAANTNQYMLLNNTGNPHGAGSGIGRENLSGVVYLEKGDPVTLQMYKGTASLTGKFQWEIVLLTSSVDINEVNIIAADDVYSTDEQLVGSYLGKPLYKKTFVLNNPTDGQVLISSGVEVLVDWNANGTRTGGGRPTNYAVNGGGAGTFQSGFYAFLNESTGQVSYYARGTIAQTGTQHMTVWYTKTTDTAGSAPNKNSLLLTRPDLWTPDTEYDFGGGLYGIRQVRTTASATMTQYPIMTGVKKIVSYGGTEFRTGDGYGHPVGTNPGTAYPYLYIQGGTMTSGTGTLSMWGAGTTMQGWDVWVTYTK